MSKMFWSDADGRAVSVQEAMSAWSLAAWLVLEDVAAHWKRTITPTNLAFAVQKQSGILTSMPSDTWIGPVISLVAQRAHESKGVQLTCYIVTDDGCVPDSYTEVLQLDGLEPSPEKMQEHALQQRWLGHKAYRAKIPENGVLTVKRTSANRVASNSKIAAGVSRTESGSAGQNLEPKPNPVCPKCYLELPPNGHCDWCD